MAKLRLISVFFMAALCASRAAADDSLSADAIMARVATNQVAPFAVVFLVLFAFALDPDRGVLARAAAGLFWVAVLFSSLLAIQRSYAIE